MLEKIKFLNLQPHQKIASLGCGGGLWEVMMSFEHNQLEIHLQDIDASLLNETELINTIAYFENHYKRSTDSNFSISIGNTKETKLPSNYFDKVLLINSFHEFQYQENMIGECKRILKPNGQLIIEEQLAKFTGELHEGCGKRLFLEAELIDKFLGFQIVEKIIELGKIVIKFSSIFNWQQLNCAN
jgi:ubiquinone/menaquinone biosynthesis C-methylase UbiE